MNEETNEYIWAYLRDGELYHTPSVNLAWERGDNGEPILIYMKEKEA